MPFDIQYTEPKIDRAWVRNEPNKLNDYVEKQGGLRDSDALMEHHYFLSTLMGYIAQGRCGDPEGCAALAMTTLGNAQR